MSCFYLPVFIFGLIIGSFLNALIYRIHSGESIAKGRSKCPHCGHQLAVGDLVPVASFIFLRGRCRYCQKKISWQYPLVELATASLFLALFFVDYDKYGLDWRLAVAVAGDWLVISALIIVFVYDFKWMLIPDSVVLPVSGIAFMLNLLLGYSLIGILVGISIGFGFFAVQYYISRGTWIGGGDLRLGLLMGVALSWPNVVLALFLAYIIGGIFSLGLLIAKKAGRKTEIPFGVFLAPAMIIAMIFGNRIIDWYLSIL